jgi:hypothetical protein
MSVKVLLRLLFFPAFLTCGVVHRRWMSFRMVPRWRYRLAFKAGRLVPASCRWFLWQRWNFVVPVIDPFPFPCLQDRKFPTEELIAFLKSISGHRYDSVAMYCFSGSTYSIFSICNFFLFLRSATLKRMFEDQHKGFLAALKLQVTSLVSPVCSSIMRASGGACVCLPNTWREPDVMLSHAKMDQQEDQQKRRKEEEELMRQHMSRQRAWQGYSQEVGFCARRFLEMPLVFDTMVVLFDLSVEHGKHDDAGEWWPSMEATTCLLFLGWHGQSEFTPTNAGSYPFLRDARVKHLFAYRVL